MDSNTLLPGTNNNLTSLEYNRKPQILSQQLKALLKLKVIQLTGLYEWKHCVGNGSIL